MFPNDLIFISLENWDDIWRRNQFICDALARRHPEAQLLFVGVPRNVARLSKQGRLRELAASESTVPGYHNVFTLRPLRVAPESYDWGYRFNQRLFRKAVTRRATSMRLGRGPAPRLPILWLNSHWAYDLVAHVRHAALIYDITDDWLTSSQTELDRQRTLHADSFLCRQADATIVCSPQLYQLKRELVGEGRLHLIPNGVDTAHYAGVLDRSLPVAPEIARLPRPILGYTGTLHEDRLDVDLLMQLAKTFEGSIALVGPSHLPPDRALALQKMGDIHILPAVPYQRIPEVMRGFDICITPHRVTPFTESLNPIKLWEYLASGKPIVSTPVAGFRDFPDLVRTATTAGEFLNAVATALTEPPSLPPRRQAEAQKHTWNARVDQIEAVIQEALHSPKAAQRPQPTAAAHTVAT